jgi:hypothetical protein
MVAGQDVMTLRAECVFLILPMQYETFLLTGFDRYT